MKRVLVVFGLVAATMLAVFRLAGWYSDNSALPRYCDNPRATIGYVSEILSKDNPAGDRKRRPYLIAAKLIFLVPQEDNEPQPAYLERLLDTIMATCGTRY